MDEIKKLRFGFFGFFIIVALVGFDSSVASYSNQNPTYIEDEISALWEYEDEAGKTLFLERVDNRLHNYEIVFKDVSSKIDIHWTLLAAISYQESHWNPRAISKTGVRGLMMLTQETAKEMGVKKRTDPNQSIVGGSHYFHKIFKRLPASVPLSDRVWMSLAAYNVGFKHLKDARNLTLDSGRDPNDWKEVSKSLIYILDERFQTDDSKNNKRSQETLDYVNKVKLFYRTLSLLEQTAFSFSSS